MATMKRVERLSWGDGNILHLGLGYTDVYIYKDSSNRTLGFMQFTVWEYYLVGEGRDHNKFEL